MPAISFSWLTPLSLVAILWASGVVHARLLPDPDDPADRLVVHASLAEMRGDLTLALSTYRRLLSLENTPRLAARATVRLSLLLEDAESLEEASQWLLKHDPSAPELAPWLDMLYSDDRRAELERALAACPDTLQEHLRLQVLLESGDGEEEADQLESRLERLLALDSLEWAARDVRADLFWEQVLAYAVRHKRTGQAATWIDSSRHAAVDPQAWMARCRLAAFQEDLPALKRAISIGRGLDSLEVFFPLMAGRLALAEGRSADAVTDLGVALELDPRDPALYSLYAAALEENSQLDEAERALRDLLLTDPSAEDVWLRLAALLERQGRRRESLKVYERGLEVLGELAGALLMNNYAYSLAQSGGDLESALSYSQRAVALNPGNAAFRDTLGWILFLQGHYPAAEEQLMAAYDLCLGAPDPEILEHLGRLRQLQGNFNEAAALWRKSLELKPDNRELQERLDGLQLRLPDAGEDH